MGGDLLCRHREIALYWVSLAQHTGLSSGSSRTEGCYRIISELLTFLHLQGYNCKQIQIHRFK
jgi:hypothetical protein